MGVPVAAPEINQIAIVVKDLRKTVEMYHKILGWGPWNIYLPKPSRRSDLTLRGKAVHYTVNVAETRVGSVSFEIIEPVEGPSIHREFLEKRGEGLHHIGCFTTHELDAALRNFDQMGIGVLMSGKIDGVQWYYMDTEPILKLVYETGDEAAPTPDLTYP